MEVKVFLIAWAVLVVTVFLDATERMFGQRRTVIIDASIIAGAIPVASDKVAIQEQT